MGSQHCGRSYYPDIRSNTRAQMRFKQMRFKQKRQRRIMHRCRNLSEPNRSLRASGYFGASVSLKLENFQFVT
jgi:hypothetical protein